MSLFLLGATGGTGIEVITSALRRGHMISAFVRSPQKLEECAEKITVTQGDPLDKSELQSSIRGHDAVISTYGPRLSLSKKDETLLQRFAGAVTAAMPNSGISRIVIESTAFLFKDSTIPPTYLASRIFFSDIVDDAIAMEKRFRDSLVDWTMVRPTRLTDKPKSGKYRVLEEHLPPFGFSISRGDVAEYLLRCAEHSATTGKVFGISD